MNKKARIAELDNGLRSDAEIAAEVGCHEAYVRACRSRSRPREETCVAGTSYRMLAPMAFMQATAPKDKLGPPARLMTLPLDCLVIDDRYQRAIGKQGRPNVQRILAQFDWRKFTPVVVTPVGDDFYAIIDGQHRATAAMMHPEIDEVPCMIINVTPSEAAACFAAINGCVTKITSGQIWRARVVSGDTDAAALQKVLDAAEVRVLSCKLPGVGYRPGDTLAIGTLQKMHAKYGPAILTTALQAVTQSSDGNPGCLTKSTITAMCEIVAETQLFQRMPSKLFELMDEIDVLDVQEQAAIDARKWKRGHLIVLKEALQALLLSAIGSAHGPVKQLESAA